jgi:3-oxoacyl-(acyl-carrier-protein) synthase
MRQPLYIHAAVAISPQQTFEAGSFLKPIQTSDNNMLYVQEAPYARYISPVAIRRMSRIMKVTISAAMECLNQANIKTPDAIITGTGRGGVTDMEVFVKDLIRLDEGAMNPTAFIQSTYNSPNGWIAMQSGSTGYNQTYVHRGCSFELALLDAQMLLAESDGLNVLVGCYDEMTEEYFTIRSKRGYWKKEHLNSGDLFLHSTSAGTIGGEGAAFFVLNNKPDRASACIEALSIIHNANSETLTSAVLNVLADAGLTLADLSLILTGLNGDVSQSSLYEGVLTISPESVPIAVFKHLSGEYDTAGGFALWLGNHIIAGNELSNSLLLFKGGDLSRNLPHRLDTILIINHFILGTASVTLLKRAHATSH